MLGVQTRMSMRPRSRTIVSIAAPTDAVSPMSTGAEAAPGIAAAVAAAAAWFASSTTTDAPSEAAPLATALPMPDPPPMMAAVFPLRSNNPFRLMCPQTRQENDEKPERRRGQARQRRRHARDAASGRRQVYRRHRRHAAGDRGQRFRRTRAAEVEAGENRHEQRHAEEPVEHADDADDGRRHDRQRHRDRAANDRGAAS